MGSSSRFSFIIIHLIYISSKRISNCFQTRRVLKIPKGNQNLYIEEEQIDNTMAKRKKTSDK
jgi:hypothetical protein